MSDRRSGWSAPTTDAALKKRIVRTVIEEVIADIDDEASEVVLLIHWRGGVHTEVHLPKRRRGQRNSTPRDIVEAVRQLALIGNDAQIAGILNRNGLVTGNGNRWTRERVTALRSYNKIPVFRPTQDGVEPWLNLSGAAAILGITPKTLRIAAEAGDVEGVHPLPEGPWIFARQALTQQSSIAMAKRAKRTAQYPTGPDADQQNLFASDT